MFTDVSENAGLQCNFPEMLPSFSSKINYSGHENAKRSHRVIRRPNGLYMPVSTRNLKFRRIQRTAQISLCSHNLTPSVRLCRLNSEEVLTVVVFSSRVSPGKTRVQEKFMPFHRNKSKPHLAYHSVGDGCHREYTGHRVERRIVEERRRINSPFRGYFQQPRDRHLICVVKEHATADPPPQCC